MGPPIMERQTPMLPQNTVIDYLKQSVFSEIFLNED